MPLSTTPRRPLSCLAAALLIAAPAAAAAQTVSSPSSPTTSPVQAQANRLKSDLRNLITAQEARYADRGAYAPSITELGTDRYRASEGTTVEVVNFTPNGYGAVARASGFSGSCVVHVGLGNEVAPRTEREQKHFPEGEPACDGDGIDAASRWASVAQQQAIRTLARIAKLQERHLARTGSYATVLTALEGVNVPSTLTVTLEAQQDPRFGAAFIASAVDSRHPEQSCVVRSGNGRVGPRVLTVGERKPALVELQVVCDTFK